MKNKKLIISIGTLSHGGAERVVSILSRNFIMAFKEVEILMWLDAPVHYEIDKRIKLVCLPRLSETRNRYRNIFYFRKYIKESNPDMVLSFLTPFNMLVLLAMIGLKKKVIVCERNDPHFVPGGKIVEFLRNTLYRIADGVLVQTKYGLGCYPSYIRSKMDVIYNPVVMPAYMIGLATKTKKESLFVSVGRLDRQKNHKMLLRAFYSFYETHPDYRLVIYGEGPLREETEKYIVNMGLQNAVSLPGSYKNVWEKLLSAKAFLLSSDAEGMSNALIEAMCLGLPVVSTKVSGSTDLIVNNKNGFLIDLNDDKDLAKKMTLLSEDPNVNLKFGYEASKIYESLNYETISKQWIDFLIKISNL